MKVLFDFVGKISDLLFSSFYFFNFVDDTVIDVEERKRYIQQSEKN